MNWPEVDYRRLMANRREKSEKPNNPKPIIPKPVMNKTEVRYVNEVLTPELYAKEILAWKFEPLKFILSMNVKGKRNSVTYKPDFLVVHFDRFEFVEVKAKRGDWTSMRDDARVKINVCAELFPWFEFNVVYLTKGGWVNEAC